MTPAQRATLRAEHGVFLADLRRDARFAKIAERISWAAAALIFLVIALGCSSHHAPNARPAPPARVEAHLTATPALTIAGHLVTLHGWLDDPTAAVKCPTVTWTWPNGLHSSHTSDCDPDEQVFRHSDTKQGALPAGEHLFTVTFDSEGHEWTASTTVEVH